MSTFAAIAVIHDVLDLMSRRAGWAKNLRFYASDVVFFERSETRGAR
jgi:hypothetical protein